MPSNYGEYSKPTVSGAGCSYSTLHGYNQNYFGRGGGAVGAPVASQTRSLQNVIVPSYGGVGYNTLTYNQKNPSCAGYHSQKHAYPSYPNSCGQFSSGQCGL